MSGLPRKHPRPTRRRLQLLTGALLLAALLALALTVQRRSLRPEAGPAVAEHRGSGTLPEDVESVLTRFSYSEQGEGEKVVISGRSVVRRGRRLLGLRSNLVKTNFIEGLKGRVETPKRVTEFSASAAEWDADASHPLLLNREVAVSLDGGPPQRVKNARVYLKRGVLDVNDGSLSYPMK